MHSVVEQNAQELSSETVIKSSDSSPSLECDNNFSMKEVNREVITPPCQSVNDVNQLDVTNFEKIEDSKSDVKKVIDHNGGFELEWLPTSVKLESESTLPDHVERNNESKENYSLSSIKIETATSSYEHVEDSEVWCFVNVFFTAIY